MDRSSATDPQTNRDEWQHLAAMCRASGLRPLQLGGRELLPVVQGGMGVGVSAASLAGNVAGLGGVGTVSAVDLRRRHADDQRSTPDRRDEHSGALLHRAAGFPVQVERAMPGENTQGRSRLLPWVRMRR